MPMLPCFLLMKESEPMNQTRLLLSLMSVVIVFGAFIYLLTNSIAPSTQDPALSAYDLSRPRAPFDAKALKMPISVSGEATSNGKAIYHGKGNCDVCHGAEGAGDGQAGVMLNPPPRDFTDPQFQSLRSDGELFWAIKYGVPETGMFGFVPRTMTEEEAWMVVQYVRSLGRAQQALGR